MAHHQIKRAQVTERAPAPETERRESEATLRMTIPASPAARRKEPVVSGVYSIVLPTVRRLRRPA